MKYSLLFLFFFLSVFFSQGQILEDSSNVFTRKDSLRGALRPERTSYDVKTYHLHFRVNPDQKYITGVNEMGFVIKKNTAKIQVDLYQNMSLDSVLFKNQSLTFEREYNAVFINFPKKLKKGKDTLFLKMFFSGHPLLAKKPPWDGGFIFTKDKNGQNWVAVAVQGKGASLWFPCKDHPADEAEEVTINIEVPQNLIAISNGRLLRTAMTLNGYRSFTWKDTYPINNYNITLYIGDYVHFSNQYRGIDLNYYVLPYHLKQAKKQFQQVKPMLDCFEKYFGPYPFKRDGYKLVEAPYLGMEHQSAIAYGNHFKNGYLGMDLSGTGIGLKWDFIIIHESAHEWFGNSISASDLADMWIHESLATYAESVFVECQFGEKKAQAYLVGIRKNVKNKFPIQGVYGVHDEGSGDMYYKGANMWNTIRSIVNKDKLWWNTLKKFVHTFQYQTIDKKEVIDFFNQQLGRNLTTVFNQYITQSSLPILAYKLNAEGELLLSWKGVIDKFKMPVSFWVKKKKIYVEVPSNHWKNTKIRLNSLDNIQLDTTSFYIQTRKM